MSSGCPSSLIISSGKLVQYPLHAFGGIGTLTSLVEGEENNTKLPIRWLNNFRD